MHPQNNLRVSNEQKEVITSSGCWTTAVAGRALNAQVVRDASFAWSLIQLATFLSALIGLLSPGLLGQTGMGLGTKGGGKKIAIFCSGRAHALFFKWATHIAGSLSDVYKATIFR